MDALIPAALDLVNTYGVVVLLFVFVLEGALVGKLIPTRTLFVAVVLAAGSDAFAFLPVAAAAIVGATIGQCVLFVSVRHYGLDPTELDIVPVSDDRLNGANRWFDRWGLPAVAVTNALPGTRGWLALPTATSSVSTTRFAAASLVGSVTYTGALVAVAVGIERAVRFLAGVEANGLFAVA
ncbi:DedA family protein [Halorubrum sp. DTA98]|uniref:DedA family protein n=1 Tax=Halorubrum sp. DTA98 TaxID=3402163 RepID=UPI003AAE368B